MIRPSRPLAWLLPAALLLPALALGDPAASKRTEAAAISQVAAAKARAREFGLCAELFHQAYRVDPSFLGYLYSAARCEQKGARIDAAERDYRAFLARAPASDPLVARATRHLDAILAQRAAAPRPKPAAPQPATPQPATPQPATPQPATPQPATTGASSPEPAPSAGPPPSVVAGPAPPATWKRPAGLACAIGGGALAVGGVTLAILGWLDRSDLKRRLGKREGGFIVDITPAEAHRSEEDYRDRLRLGGVLGGAGVVVAAAGAWMLSSAPDAGVSLRSLPGGGAVVFTAAWR